jgi:hypothetical protein
MADTYTLISKIEVAAGASQSTLSFTSIPATYTDLELRISCRSTTNLGTDTLAIRFNSDTSSNYYTTLLQGYGSSGASGANVGTGTQGWMGLIEDSANGANIFSTHIVRLADYRGSGNKTVLSDAYSSTNLTASLLRLFGDSWNNSAAITSIDINILSAGSGYVFGQYTNAYLYGIKNS